MDTDGTLLVQAAQWAGRHAFPLYLTALVALLAAAWALWWSVRRHLLPRVRDAGPAWWALALGLASGFAAIVAGAWVFAEVAEALHAQVELGRADQALTDAVRLSVPPQALWAFSMITRLADTATLTGLGIVGALGLAVAGRRLLGLGWALALGGNGLLNHSLKQVFERVRPVHDDGLVLADGFSFPSGHSSGAVVACGMLAYVGCRLLAPRWHLPLVLGAVALAFSVGVSRVMLRVHFASDVIAGFASGLAWLAVCVTSIELTRWMRGRANR